MKRYTNTPFSFVNLVFDLIEALLVVRFFFVFLRANSAQWFVSMLYATTDLLVAPFRGIFPTTSIGPFLAEWSTIVALIVYALLSIAIVRLLNLFFSTMDTDPDGEKVSRDNRKAHQA